MTLNLVVTDKGDVFFRCQLLILPKNTSTLIVDSAIIRPQFNDLCLRIKLKYMFENTVCEGKVVCKLQRQVINVLVLDLLRLYSKK